MGVRYYPLPYRTAKGTTIKMIGGKIMEIEREIELLKEKVALLEKVKELQDMIKNAEVLPYIRYVPYPVYPNYPWPTIHYEYGTISGDVLGYSPLIQS